VKRPSLRSAIWSATHQTLVVITLLVLLFPIYYLVMTSLTTPDQIISHERSVIIPRHLSLDGYRAVLANPNFGRYVLNSLFVAATVTVLSVSISGLGAYSLARLPFPTSRLLGRVVLLAYVAPPVLLAIPMFVGLSKLRIVDTPFALILAHLTFALPFCLWMLRGFFLSLPLELEDAAAVDGCTPLRAFCLIVLPLARPAIAAAAMFAFLLSWNEYFYALIFLQNNAQMTLPVGIQSSYFNVVMGPDNWIRLLCGSVLASIPVFVLFGGLQRWMVGGLTAGAVRG
jgi:ABC-type glycerol-3-phosphate transport system permease component